MIELTKEEEKEIVRLSKINKYLGYQQAKRIVLERSKQKRL